MLNNWLSLLLAVFLLLGVPGGRGAGPGSGEWSVPPSTGVIEPAAELPPLGALPPRDLSVLAGRIIAVDPGHGGANPGAHGPSGTAEADNTLAIARYLQAELEKAGAHVVMTRTGWQAPGIGELDQLKARTLLANRSRADVFVSIHNDSNPDRTKTGPTTYYYSPGSSRRLARDVQAELVQSLGAVDNGTVRRSFYVLRHTRMPAVLVEAGFITTPADDARLRDPVYQRRIALGIARGLARYFGG